MDYKVYDLPVIEDIASAAVDILIRQPYAMLALMDMERDMAVIAGD